MKPWILLLGIAVVLTSTTTRANSSERKPHYKRIKKAKRTKNGLKEKMYQWKVHHYEKQMAKAYSTRRMARYHAQR
jgi:hypothetical protein